MRVDGKFIGPDGSIPEGQGIVMAHLNECHELLEMVSSNHVITDISLIPFEIAQRIYGRRWGAERCRAAGRGGWRVVYLGKIQEQNYFLSPHSYAYTFSWYYVNKAIRNKLYFNMEFEYCSDFTGNVTSYQSIAPKDIEGGRSAGWNTLLIWPRSLATRFMVK